MSEASCPPTSSSNAEIATVVLVGFLVVHKIFKLSLKTYYTTKIKRANEAAEDVPV